MCGGRGMGVLEGNECVGGEWVCWRGRGLGRGRIRISGSQWDNLQVLHVQCVVFVHSQEMCDPI